MGELIVKVAMEAFNTSDAVVVLDNAAVSLYTASLELVFECSMKFFAFIEENLTRLSKGRDDHGVDSFDCGVC